MKFSRMAVLLLLVLCFTLTLLSCGESPVEQPSSPAVSGEASSSGTSEQKSDMAWVSTVTVKGVAITMHADAAPILAALGKESSYYESASCAFVGLDKQYTYPGFVLFTYPDGDTDRVSKIVFTDDSLTTDKGLYIGMAGSTVTEKLGAPSSADNGSYTYENETARLLVLTTGGSVSSIQYIALTE